MSTADAPTDHLTRQFLAWVAEAPRTYADAMEAWRTSCPRMTIWEDAVRDGLVRLTNGHGAMRETRVTLTERGATLLSNAKS
jgi:hypothetical protein